VIQITMVLLHINDVVVAYMIEDTYEEGNRFS